MLEKLARKRSYIIIAVLLVLLVLFPFNWFLGKYTSLMILIGIYSMVTVGLCLLMGYTGQVSLGQAAFFGIGAYFSAVLSKTYHVDPWLAMLIGALVSAAFAYVIGYPIFRLKGNYLAMATLGIGLVIWILFRQLVSVTGGPDGLSDIPRLSIGGFAFNTSFKMYFLVWFFCLIVLFLSQNIIKSRIGRALRAIHGSETAAQSLGVNVAQFKVKVFVLSAVYASLAGSLLTHNSSSVGPTSFDFMGSVKFVVMAVIGGLASIWGAVFGAGATHVLSDQLLVGFGHLDIIIYGLILILVMIFTPDGLFVALKSTVKWLKPNWRNLPAILKQKGKEFPSNIKRVGGRWIGKFRFGRNES